MNALKNWKTTLAAVPFLGITFLLYTRSVTAEQAIAILAAAGAYLAAVAGDAGKPAA